MGYIKYTVKNTHLAALSYTSRSGHMSRGFLWLEGSAVKWGRLRESNGVYHCGTVIQLAPRGSLVT
jgi:hypothetical protein